MPFLDPISLLDNCGPPETPTRLLAVRALCSRFLMERRSTKIFKNCSGTPRVENFLMFY